MSAQCQNTSRCIVRMLMFVYNVLLKFVYNIHILLHERNPILRKRLKFQLLEQ